MKAAALNFYQIYKPILSFFLKLILIYLAWRLLMEFLGEQSAPAKEQMWPWLTVQWRAFCELVLTSLQAGTVFLLQLMGFETIAKGDMVGIVGERAVAIGHYCLGLELWALFSALVLVYPAPWKHKLWIIPVGVAIIHGINILRCAALALLVVYAPERVDFDHHFTFRIIVFTFILIMYWFVLDKLSTKDKPDPPPSVKEPIQV